MKIVHRLSISAAAFLIGLGASPVLAQTVTATDKDNTPAATSVNANGASFNAANNNDDNDSLHSKAIDRMVDQDLGQQQRIEQGLKDDQLTTAEAARLEQDETRIDKLESNALKNGNVSAQEAAQIRQAEYGLNGQITRLDDNHATGTASGNADMTADVQRDINQQQRIDRGINDGQLTPTEVSALEGGQATVSTDESRDGRNNQITSSEQQNIQGAQNAQNTDIRNDAHNGMTVSSGQGYDRNGQRYDRDDRGQRDRDHFAYYDRGNQNGQNGQNSQNGQSAQNGMTGDNDFRRDHRFDDEGNQQANRQDHDGMNHDHYADNGDHDRDHHNYADNGQQGEQNPTGHDHWWDNGAVPNNTSGNVTANAVNPMATNANADVIANTSASAPVASNSASVATGNAASVTPVSAPALAPAPAPHVTPHVTPHIPVAPK